MKSFIEWSVFLRADFLLKKLLSQWRSYKPVLQFQTTAITQQLQIKGKTNRNWTISQEVASKSGWNELEQRYKGECFVTQNIDAWFTHTTYHSL